MAQAKHRFKRSSAYGKPGEGAYYRRRARLAKRTRLVRTQTSALDSFAKAKEELFNRLFHGKEKPSEVAKEIISEASGLSERAKEKLLSAGQALNLDWQTIREYKKRTPAELFEERFGIKPSNNAILLDVSSCHIHLGLGLENWQLLRRAGIVDSSHTLGQYEGGFYELGKITSYSLAEFDGKFGIRQDIMEEEKRHHFQDALIGKSSKKFGSIERAQDIIRREFAPRIMVGTDPFRALPLRIREEYENEILHLKELREHARRIMENADKITHSDILQEVWRKGWRKYVEDYDKQIQSTQKSFGIVFDLLRSESFRSHMIEAMNIVPKDILASFMETVSLRRLETLLPELIQKYKKKKGKTN